MTRNTPFIDTIRNRKQACKSVHGLHASLKTKAKVLQHPICPRCRMSYLQLRTFARIVANLIPYLPKAFWSPSDSMFDHHVSFFSSSSHAVERCIQIVKVSWSGSSARWRETGSTTSVMWGFVDPA